jgi:hypothetical protein
MIRYLLQEPDALALLLLLLAIAVTVVSSLVGGQRRGRPDQEPGLPAEGRAAPKVTTWPHLLRRELIAALLALLVLSWGALLLELPLGTMADPRVTPAVAKAPWFFVGLQEMLQYFDAWLAGAVLPFLLFLGLILLPYLDIEPPANALPASAPSTMGRAVLWALFLLGLLPMVVGQLFRGENWSLQPAWSPAPLATAPLPAMHSLAARLGIVHEFWAQLLGASLCLGPYLVLLVSWLGVRHQASVLRLGPTRYLLIGLLGLSFMQVLLKVLLQLLFDVRYFWMTPWFNI